MNKYRFLFVLAFALFVMLPFKVSAMQIFVQNPSEQDLVVEVESSDTIEAVKEKIYQLNNTFLPENQQLFFGDRTMEDGRTLADYNVQKGSIVHLLLIKVKLILDANSGTFIDSDQYIINYSNNEDLVTPTKEGYTFKGWYTEKVGGLTLDYYSQNNEVVSEMTFYAQWNKNGKTLIDFTNAFFLGNLTELESILIDVLINKGFFTLSKNRRNI